MADNNFNNNNNGNNNDIYVDPNLSSNNNPAQPNFQNMSNPNQQQQQQYMPVPGQGNVPINPANNEALPSYQEVLNSEVPQQKIYPQATISQSPYAAASSTQYPPNGYPGNPAPYPAAGQAPYPNPNPNPNPYYGDVKNPNMNQPVMTPNVIYVNCNPQSIPRCSAKFMCPNCNKVVDSDIVYENNAIIWILVIILFLFTFCLFCIPFCIDDLKDIVHYCPLCRREIARKARFNDI